MDYIALKKFRYPASRGGKEYVAGDPVRIENERDAKVLTAVRMIKPASLVQRATPVPAATPAHVLTTQPVAPAEAAEAASDAVDSDAELDALRAEYERLAGEAPDRRWGERRLRTKIDVLSA